MLPLAATSTRNLHSAVAPPVEPLRPAGRKPIVVLASPATGAAQRSLRGEMPLLHATLGPLLFDQVAREYLAWRERNAHGLKLREDLPRFLQTACSLRPSRPGALDFLIELARLEAVIGELLSRDHLDAERLRLLRSDALAALSDQELGRLRLQLSPALRLHVSQVPLRAHCQRALAGDPAAGLIAGWPTPGREVLALVRSGDEVRRLPVSESDYLLLDGLRRGLDVSAAALRAGAPPACPVSGLTRRRLLEHAEAGFFADSGRRPAA
jgi:hypothetical protein